MPHLIHEPPRQFGERLDVHDLRLRGVRARAFQFQGGAEDRARALVCVAGMGADGRSFVRQKPLSQGWLVLPLNLPYETPPEADPVEFAAEVVEEYIDHEGLDRPVLLGSSFGGAVAARVAVRRAGRIRGLVLANAVLARRQIPLAFPQFIDLLQAPEPLAQLIAPLAAQVMGGFALDREARDEIVREARHFSTEELRRRLRSLLGLDLLPQLAQLDLPVLAIHGTRDWLVPPRRGEWTATHARRGRFVSIVGAGHLPYLSHPTEFNVALANFLEEVIEVGRARQAEKVAPPA